MSYVDKEFGGSVRSLTVNSGQRDGVSPTMPAMPTTTKQHLRSKRGRPKGSFRDPALRAQAWHWLSELLMGTGETDPRRFDDAKGAHRLSRGLPVGRRFTRVMEDGYDPRNISAGKFQLFDHVKKRRKFSQATAAYTHPLFKYMQDRELGSARELSWIKARLHSFGLTLMSDMEHSHARAFGFVSHDGWVKGSTDWYVDEKSTLAPLRDQLEALSSLDGVYLLVALHRLVIDTSPSASEYATQLSALLFDAAMGLARRYRYGPEQHDTWRLLVETRLCRWIPEVRITEEEMSAALARLNWEFEQTERSVAGRPKLGPLQVGRGRAERRWRRYAHVVAALKCLDSHEFPWLFAACTDGTRWIEQNSKGIQQRLHTASRKGYDPSKPEYKQELPPISMPTAVQRLRRSHGDPNAFHNWLSVFVDRHIIIE